MSRIPAYNTRIPSVSDLKARARRRLPRFAFEYVDGGIDDEYGKRRNREAWHRIQLTPRYLVDVGSADLETEVFGRTYSMPFGAPPIGLGNMMWPGAEAALAAACQRAGVPYIQSSMSTTELEKIATIAPDVCWFQLYVPRKVEVMKDMIERVRRSGFHALVITLDIPVGAKRNRELRNAVGLPFRPTLGTLWQGITHPVWSLATVAHGFPDFVNLTRYREGKSVPLAEFLTSFNMPGVTRERVEMIRELWDGPLVLKGTQYADEFRAAVDIGVDGIVISNHGGRQLDAAPSSADTLANLPEDMHHKLTIMVDSGIRTGMDVVRATALGAKMTFSGRSFFWGMGGMGKAGGDQVIGIFHDEITRTLQQLGCGSIREMDRSWLHSAD